jgi:hypothetical protein
MGHPVMNPIRSRPVVAATVESYSRDGEMYYDRMDGNEYTSELVVGALNTPHHRGTESELSDTCSVSSVPSSISAPTRSCVSAPGSIRPAPVFEYPRSQEVNAIDHRPRTCHLCFNLGHFIMKCPFLGKEASQLVQENRMRATQGKTSRQGGTPKLPAIQEYLPEQRAPIRSWDPPQFTSAALSSMLYTLSWRNRHRNVGRVRMSRSRRKTGRETRRDAWYPQTDTQP